MRNAFFNQNSISKISLLIVVIIKFTNIHAATLPTDYFRSISNGDWASPATWQSSSNNINWSAATASPTSAANTITIQASNKVNVTSAISLDQTIINGVLEIQNGGILSINDGTGDDITINNGGVLRTLGTSAYSTQIIYLASSGINILSGGKITVGDGTNSVSNGFSGFATNPQNSWNTNAIFEWNNNSAFTTNNATYFPNADASTKPVFQITKVSATVGSSNPTIINGILETNCNLTFGSSGAKTFRDGLKGTGILTLSGTGTISITSSTAVLTGSLTLIINKTLNATNGLTTPAGSSIKIDDASITGLNISNANFVIAAGATFDIGASASVAISSTYVMVYGVFRTANIYGLNGVGGTSVPSGNIYLQSGSTVDYYASVPQKISIRTDYYNLILSGGGTKTLAVNNTIAPIYGTVTIPDNTIVDVANNTFGSDATNFTMLNGRFRCSGVLTKPDMNGTYNLSGGVVEFYNSSGTPQSVNSKAYFNIEVTGNNVRNSNGNLELNNGGSFTIKNGGVFSINDEAIIGPGGTQTVTVESGGTFKTGDADGFSGGSGASTTSIRNDIENINLATGSTVEYNRSLSGSQFVTGRSDYYHLTLSGTSNKTFNADCSVAGNFNVTGGLVNAPLTISFIGTSGTQDISGLSYRNIVFSGTASKRFTSDGSLSGTVSMNGNNISLDADGVSNNINFTLKSTAASTARINDLTNGNTNSGNTITGNVIVERFIPLGRKWRLLCVPFSSSSQTINNAWQEGQSNPDTYTQLNPNPGYGTNITYDNIVSHGFDVNTTTHPSLVTWDLTNQKWSDGAPFTKTTLITDYTGYYIFVRGSRAVNLSQGIYASQDATTLRAKGVLAQGNINHNFGVTKNGDFVFVGNPYASSINFIDFLATNSTAINPNNLYVWDPKITGNYGLGGYIIYNSITGWSNTSGSYSSTSPPVIQSGQAFFVVANTTNGNIQFKETDKTSTEYNVFGKQVNYPKIYVRLNIPSSDKIINADGIVAAFDGNISAGVDEYDAKKLYSSTENIAFDREGFHLGVEVRPLPKHDDSLFLNLFINENQQYNLEIIPQNFTDNAIKRIFLLDKYLNKIIPINPTDTTFYTFTRDSNATSYRNRFIIVFNHTLFIATPHKVDTKINGSDSLVNIIAYPNPALKNDKIQLQLNNVPAGKYLISLQNLHGDVLFANAIVHNSNHQSYSIPLSNTILPGQYLIGISGNKSKKYQVKIVITE